MKDDFVISASPATSASSARNKLPRPRGWFWILLGAILTIDQISKFFIIRSLGLHENIIVIPGFFNITRVHNDGIAFGLLQGNNLLLGGLAVLILALGFWWSRKLDWRTREVNVLAGMITAGALGNLIDRFQWGYVIDFLDFHVGAFSWPAFNVADSCISLSVVYIFLRMFFHRVDAGENRG